MLRIFLLFRALAFFFVPGAAMIVLGGVYSAVVMSVNRQGFPVAGLLVVMTGVLTVFMGLIADQLSLIRRERFENLSQTVTPDEAAIEDRRPPEAKPPQA